MFVFLFPLFLTTFWAGYARFLIEAILLLLTISDRLIAWLILDVLAICPQGAPATCPKISEHQKIILHNTGFSQVS